MNLVVLMGRLTRDPAISHYGEAGDKTMARYTLAVERIGRQEEGQQTADFISCLCYGKNAEFASKWLRQGVKIAVEGRIQTGSFTNKEGQKVYTTDVVVGRQEFAESKRADTSSGQAAGIETLKAEEKQDDGFMNIPDGITEDLPFN